MDEVIPSIVRNWDVDKLIASSSPELLQVAPPDKMTALFASFARKLGPLKELHESRGDSNVSYWNGKKATTAAYRINADFAKGPATINVTLIRHGEHWQVLKLYVNSDLLLQ